MSEFGETFGINGKSAVVLGGILFLRSEVLANRLRTCVGQVSRAAGSGRFRSIGYFRRKFLCRSSER